MFHFAKKFVRSIKFYEEPISVDIVLYQSDSVVGLGLTAVERVAALSPATSADGVNNFDLFSASHILHRLFLTCYDTLQYTCYQHIINILLLENLFCLSVRPSLAMLRLCDLLNECDRKLIWLFKKPSGHYMYKQFNINKFYVLPTQCIYVFCVDLRKNRDFFPIQH